MFYKRRWHLGGGVCAEPLGGGGGGEASTKTVVEPCTTPLEDMPAVYAERTALEEKTEVGLVLRVDASDAKKVPDEPDPSVLAGWVTSVVTTTLPDAMEVTVT